MEMSEQIMRFVEENPNASFAELSKNIEGFNGDFVFVLNRNSTKKKRAFLWVGMSKEAIEAFSRIGERILMVHDKFSKVCYFIDGLIPNEFKDEETGIKYFWVPVTLKINKMEARYEGR